jgi:hypothetical protein
MTDPLPIPERRWKGDLAYLREIPPDERPRWRVSPPVMTYAAANRWAREVIRADKIIPLSSGETLVRLPAPRPSPWGLP